MLWEGGMTFDQFTSALKDVSAQNPTSVDFQRVSQGGGGISSKEELALFLAFVLWESSEDGQNENLACLDMGGRSRGSSPKIGRKRLTTAGANIGHFSINNGWIQSLDKTKIEAELAWDVAFWFWERKCHNLAAKNGFWAVLSKVNSSQLNTAKGQERLEHYKRVAKAIGVLQILE